MVSWHLYKLNGMCVVRGGNLIPLRGLKGAGSRINIRCTSAGEILEGSRDQISQKTDAVILPSQPGLLLLNKRKYGACCFTHVPTCTFHDVDIISTPGLLPVVRQQKFMPGYSGIAQP